MVKSQESNRRLKSREKSRTSIPRLEVMRFCPPRPRCPKCRIPGTAQRRLRRVLHDLGNSRPVDIAVDYKRYRCPKCERYFDCIPRTLVCDRSPYTRRVILQARKLVIDGGLSIRQASHELKTKFWVHVPPATIFNWTTDHREPDAVSFLLAPPQPD